MPHIDQTPQSRHSYYCKVLVVDSDKPETRDGLPLESRGGRDAMALAPELDDASSYEGGGSALLCCSSSESNGCNGCGEFGGLCAESCVEVVGLRGEARCAGVGEPSV